MERRMTVQKQRSNSQADAALRFRTSLPVTEVILYRSGDTYPICPQCRCSLDREYQNFCDRCGQKLGWGKYHRALVVTKF